VYTEKCIREREIIITPERGKMEKGNNNKKKKKKIRWYTHKNSRAPSTQTDTKGEI
jgi:hypothetical protein